MKVHCDNLEEQFDELEKTQRALFTAAMVGWTVALVTLAALFWLLVGK
jgi:hypothetical protein